MFNLQGPLGVHHEDASSPPDIDASEEVIPIEGEDRVSSLYRNGTAHICMDMDAF